MHDQWDACLHVLEGNSGWIGGLAFSPDGKILTSGSDDKTVRLWEMETRTNVLLLTGHSDYVYMMVFSHDGRVLASGSRDKTVRVWDTNTAKSVELRGHSRTVTSLAFMPDGKSLASGSTDNTIRFWNVATATTVRHFVCLNGETVAFSPDGRTMISLGEDNNLQIWDLATNAIVQELAGHRRVDVLTFSTEGKMVASISADSRADVSDLATATTMSDELEYPGLTGDTAVAFSPGGNLAAFIFTDGRALIWDTIKREILYEMDGNYSDVIQVALSPNGDRIALKSHNDDLLRIFDPTLETSRYYGMIYGEAIQEAMFSPHGKLAALVLETGNVVIQDLSLKNGYLAEHEVRDSDFTKALAFSFDESMLAYGSLGGTVKIWDIPREEVFRTLQIPESASNDRMRGRVMVMAVAFSSDGKMLAAGSDDQTIRIWDTAMGGTAHVLTGHFGSVKALAFAPSGKIIASGSGDQTVRIWNLSTGNTSVQCEWYEGWDDPITTVAFSPDGKMMASGSSRREGNMRLWDAATGALLCFWPKQGLTRRLPFSSDGSYLCTDCGNIPLPPSLALQSSSGVVSRADVGFQDDWLLLGKRRTVWMPPSYRPTSNDVHNNSIIMSLPDGRFSLFKLTAGSE